jgi:hypothetical protein
MASYVPPRPVQALPECCQQWVASDPELHRSTCPQHRVANKMRYEELTWIRRYKSFRDQMGFDDDWVAAGFTIVHGLAAAA